RGGFRRALSGGAGRPTASVPTTRRPSSRASPRRRPTATSACRAPCRPPCVSACGSASRCRSRWRKPRFWSAFASCHATRRPALFSAHQRFTWSATETERTGSRQTMQGSEASPADARTGPPRCVMDGAVHVCPLSALPEVVARYQASHLLTCLQDAVLVATPDLMLPERHLRLHIHDI